MSLLSLFVAAAVHSAPLPVQAAPDSAALHERAERLQNRFEEFRRNALPRARPSGGFQDCDEVVGRFCLRFGGGSDWEPVLDPPEVLQARGDLLDSLSHIAAAIPGDAWVVGQLVHYLGEEGRWVEALSWVDDCSIWDEAAVVAERSVFDRALPGWWCHALSGLVLHRADRYEEAEEAFRTALDRMGPGRRIQWLDLDLLLDGRADDLWDDTRGVLEEDEAGVAVAVRDRFRERIWDLSDPLWLVEGNDRLTEHFARYTVSWIREEGENPYGLVWGWDLEHLVVRYGAEMGWNRAQSPAGSLQPATVIGHHHPESRPFLPPGGLLADGPAHDDWRWRADDDHPVTSYAAPYAPDLRFEPYQIARFRRGEEMWVVAGYRLPPDTTDAADEERQEERQEDLEAALFLAPVESPRPGPSTLVARHGGPDPSGALLLRAPLGEYVASLEVWSPERARAGRLRRGLALEPLPADAPAISDLVLLDGSAGTDPGAAPTPSAGVPNSLEAVLPHVRPTARICVGETLGVGWELTGLGPRRPAVALSLRLEPPEPGLFSRIGGFLGLTDHPEPLILSWTESGPDSLEPFFRVVSLATPPELEPGTYRLRVEAELQGRDPLASERDVEVLAAPECVVA